MLRRERKRVRSRWNDESGWDDGEIVKEKKAIGRS